MSSKVSKQELINWMIEGVILRNYGQECLDTFNETMYKRDFNGGYNTTELEDIAHVIRDIKNLGIFKDNDIKDVIEYYRELVNWFTFGFGG